MYKRDPIIELIENPLGNLHEEISGGSVVLHPPVATDALIPSKSRIHQNTKNDKNRHSRMSTSGIQTTYPLPHGPPTSQTFSGGFNCATPSATTIIGSGESGDYRKSRIHQSQSQNAIGTVGMEKGKRIPVNSPRNRHSSGSLPSEPLLLMTSTGAPIPPPPNNINPGNRVLQVHAEDDGYASSINFKSSEGIPLPGTTPSLQSGSTAKGMSNHHNNSPDGEHRETWGKSVDFLLSIIGFAVDLANVQRFPYYCYKNGGGAFLIPYFMMLIFGAIPIFYMELLLGQSIRQGPISMWRICPLFKGIGYCAVAVSYFVSWYYNTTMGWALHYTISSFESPLPWTTCNNSWNTVNCTLATRHDNQTRHIHAVSPANEYYRRGVLGMNDHSMDKLGPVKLDLLFYVAIVYCLLYLIISKGIRSSGKVVWVTATLPYVVLAVLLVRGLFLDGAMNGISYYLTPNITKLREIEVWSDAAKQIFFSSGAGFGVHLTYASYNNFHNNCFRDCIITSIVNCGTSIFSGFVIFTFLGSMAYEQNRPIDEVVTIGPGLVFEVYPEAIGYLPGSNFWSVLFFLMLIMLGVDSAMGGLECVITGISDEFHKWFHGRKHSKELFKIGVVLSSFIISIINVSRGGMYTYNFLDAYAAGLSLLLAVLFEVLVVAWVYGLDQLCKDAGAMLGSPPGLFWRICWKFISPALIASIIILDLINSSELMYDDYVYPEWAQIFGLIFTFIPISFVPIFAIVELMKFPGTCKRKLAYAITPINEHELVKNGVVTRFRLPHWLYIW